MKSQTHYMDELSIKSHYKLCITDANYAQWPNSVASENTFDCTSNENSNY